MKKTFLLLGCLTLLSFSLFSEQYKIKDVSYSVEGAGFKFLGATKPSILKTKYPVNTKKIFNSREELESYIENYKKSLDSSRAFDSIDVNYETSFSDSSDINDVLISVKLADSHHLVIMPYPKYSSDSGASIKLKIKDTNFLGTLNTMNAELNAKGENGVFKPGLSFDFDLPFSLGNINCTFVNDYSMNYVVADSEDERGFEWNTKTGIEMSIPFEVLPLNIGFYQGTGGDLDYKKYGDYSYFTEKLSVGTSYAIKEFSNYTSLSYSPSVSLTWNWDFDGIDEKNDSLSSPVVSFSHSLSNGKVTWNNNFRSGYNLSLGNTISYNFHRRDWNPSINFNAEYYMNFKTNDQEYFNRYGICSKLYAYYYFEVPSNQYKKQYDESFGDRLRGVLNRDCGSYPAAIIWSLDLPHNMFTSEFDIDIINFNLQASPFFDMALVYDKENKRVFDPYDGYYCAGLEFLVYPLRWSSITVRASFGMDINKARQCYNFLQAISEAKEIFIGIGLQY